MDTAHARIDPSIRQAILAGTEPPVVIALTPPPNTASAEERQTLIRQMQDEVLAALPSEHYAPRIRYEAVPALAGTLRTLEGLEILRSHPRVLRVDMDPAGGGTNSEP